jgi:hypothetical protein
LRARYPNTPESALRRAVRLNLEMALAATELVLEEPDDEPEEISAEYSHMIVAYYARFS